MGLGGYLAARSEREHYDSERARELREIEEVPELERSEVRDILAGHGLEADVLDKAVAAVTSNRQRWLEFMMRNELSLEAPDPARARNSAVTIGVSYVAGGILPLIPYGLGLHIMTALAWSTGLTLTSLLVFGGVKGRFTGVSPSKAAIQTAMVGGLAAGAAYLFARLVSGLA
jgi:VIT1/CCC1 family predicted Fe2+/Mn2+ transporter